MALNWFMPAKAKGSGRVSAKQAAGRHVEGGGKKAVSEDKREYLPRSTFDYSITYGFFLP
jgi:hypothetical protein